MLAKLLRLLPLCISGKHKLLNVSTYCLRLGIQQLLSEMSGHLDAKRSAVFTSQLITKFAAVLGRFIKEFLVQFQIRLQGMGRVRPNQNRTLKRKKIYEQRPVLKPVILILQNINESKHKYTQIQVRPALQRWFRLP